MNVEWEEHVTNIIVRKRAGQISIEVSIFKHGLRWASHVVRKDIIWGTEELHTYLWMFHMTSQSLTEVKFEVFW